MRVSSRTSASVFRLDNQNSSVVDNDCTTIIENSDISKSLYTVTESKNNQTLASVMSKLPIIKEIAAINSSETNDDGSVQYNVVSLSKKSQKLSTNKSVQNIVKRVKVRDKVNYLENGDLVRYVIDRRVIDLDKEEIADIEYVHKKETMDFKTKLTSDIVGNQIKLRSQKTKMLFKIIETKSKIIE